MKNALRDAGFQGLGNRHTGAMRVITASIGQRRWRSTAHDTSSTDSPDLTGRYETPVHYVEIARHGAARGARLDDMEFFGRGPAPPAAHAREGEQRALSHDVARLSGPAQFLARLLKTWNLERDAALTLLGLEESQRPYLHDLLNGKAAPRGRDIKDRIAHLTVIRMTLAGLFANETVENEWLREPHRLLEDREPMSLMLEGSMENLLLVREYVDAAAGL